MDSTEQTPRSKRHKETAEGAAGAAGTANGAEAARQPKENFFTRLAQMNADDWDRFRVYIYRRWPRIARDDQPHYIGTHRQAIDEEFIRAQYGSGRYLLKLNDPKRTVDQTPLEIQDIAYPPKLNAGELVDCPENERYHKLWPADARANEATGGSNDAAIRELASLLKTVLTEKAPKEQDDIAREAARDLVQWALKQKDREREEGSPSSMAALLNALKGFMPTPPPPATPAPPQSPSAVELLRAMKELQPPAPPPPPDQMAFLLQAREILAPSAKDGESSRIAELKELLEFSQVLMRGPTRRNGWDLALDAARDVGLPVVQTVGNIITQAMALRHGQPVPGSPATPALPTAWDPYRNQAQTAAYAATLRNQQPQPATSPTPQPPPPAAPTSQQPTAPATPPPQQPASQPDNQILAIFQQYGGLVLNALNQGVTGDAFADYVAGLFGTSTHAMIANNGEDALVSTMLSIQEFQLFGEAKIRRFVWEFIHYEELGDDSESDEAEEKAAAAGR